MNIFYKLYCRAFQKMFWLAITLLPYRTPKVLKNTADLPVELNKTKTDNLLIITDKVLNGLGKLEPLKQQLALANIAYSVYDKTVPNPAVDNVEEANPLYPVPKLMRAKEIEEFYVKVSDWS